MQEFRVVRGQVQVWGGSCPTVRNQRVTWRERWGVLLELFDEEGRRGWGEASPLPGFSLDTLEQCREALEAWCQTLPLTVNAFYFQKYPPVMPEPPAARFAVEMALLDLQGKHDGGEPDFQVPVTRLLCRELYDSVAVSKLLFGRRLGMLVEQVRRGLAAGFTTFKLKLGGPSYVQDDVHLVQRLREAVPGKWHLRVDLNLGWRVADCERFLGDLAEAGVEMVEDPVPAHDLAALRGAPLPIAADEPLKEPEWRLRLAASRAAQVWVLKPTVLGGFQRCRELVTSVHPDIACIFSHCFEGPVALAAVRALALLFHGARRRSAGHNPPEGSSWDEDAYYAHGVDLHPALAAFPSWPVPGGGSPKYEQWHGGGLGVDP